MSSMLEGAARFAAGLLRGENAEAGPLSAARLPQGQRLAVHVFAPGGKSTRWISIKPTWEATVRRCVEKIRGRLNGFDWNGTPFNVIAECMVERGDVDPNALHQQRFDDQRYEPGITGFVFRPGPAGGFDEESVVYTPMDAWIRSHNDLGQLRSSWKESVRKAIARDPASVRVTRTDSTAVLISTDGTASELYRGAPPPPPWNVASVNDLLLATAAWLHDHRHPDGRFWYYYDPWKDTLADHTHAVLKAEFYNWVRHNHAILPLLDASVRFGRPEFVETSKQALRLVIDTGFTYERAGGGPGIFSGKRRCLICNQKGKLGSAGIGLVALMRYRELTRDDRFLPETLEILRHVDGQLLPSGEFQGYYVHPAHNDGKPLDTLTDEVRRQLFSFYYPGEALFGMGLALALLDLGADEKAYLTKRIVLALDYLTEKRPTDYAELFLPLPSDGWLVQAIECLLLRSGLSTPGGIAFAKSESRKLCAQMYDETAPYRDYDGGFYYKHGDVVYVDSARMEGLVAAYRIAQFLDDKAWLDDIRAGCARGARSLLRLYNTKDHCYTFPRPEHGVATYRLKLTRQWTRIDNSAHAYGALSNAIDLGLVPT